MKTISVITPCYNEQENVRDVWAAVKAIFDGELAGYRKEHIFCDNCSTDNTLAELRQIAAEDKDVKIIVNTRNFGPLRNTYNGVMASTGDAVLLFLPADMQDPPQLLPKFVRFWEQGYEIVYGVRAIRRESWTMRSIRGLYYRLLTSFTEMVVPPGVGDFQLVDRRIVEAMRNINDVYPFMRMMTFECGGKAIAVPYTWERRQKGVSKNRLRALVDQGMNGFVSFTKEPVRIGLFAGLALAALSLFYAFVNLIIGLVFYREIANPGIMTIIVSLFFFGGVQLFFLGMIGEYVLAIYGQVRTKPTVYERERINFGPAAAAPAQTPGSPGSATTPERINAVGGNG